MFRRSRHCKKGNLLVGLLGIFMILFILNSLFKTESVKDVRHIPSSSLELYFSLEENMEIEWYYFAAMDVLEKKWTDNIEEQKYQKISRLYREKKGDVPKTLKGYKSKRYAKKIIKKTKAFREIDDIYRNKKFPIFQEVSYQYENGWGDGRTYGGDRKHEGVDIITDKGVPIYSVGAGKITNVGWNELGGWRVGITGDDGVYYYYAHLDGYEKTIKQGKNIQRGEVIGYVGNTGYGPEGTQGKFVDHLHFGMYKEGEAINPYPFLRGWEMQEAN